MGSKYKSTNPIEAEDHQELVFVAKLAEQAERYEEMVAAMKTVVEEGKKLSVEERNLLSVGYKNVVGVRRSSWRMLSSMETIAEAESVRRKTSVILRTNIEQEIRTFCDEVLDLLEKFLIPQCEDLETNSVENNVFYIKMRADYYRYLAEVSLGEERTNNAIQSKISYEDAGKLAENLSVTNYIRLGLALNFSTYWYDIAGSRREACLLARKAFDDAIPELNRLDEVTSYKETALILQLLRDNLTLWINEEEEEFQRQRHAEKSSQDNDAEQGEKSGQGQQGYYR